MYLHIGKGNIGKGKEQEKVVYVPLLYINGSKYSSGIDSKKKYGIFDQDDCFESKGGKLYEEVLSLEEVGDINLVYLCSEPNPKNIRWQALNYWVDGKELDVAKDDKKLLEAFAWYIIDNPGFLDFESK